MKFYKMPGLVQKMFPKAIWRHPLDSGKNVIYLTFDDGPHPEITLQVVEELRKYDAKATFFCVGANVEAYPEVFDLLKKEGHSVGNHTYNHMDGWRNDLEAYVQNIDRCQKLTQTNLFRPPYGRLKYGQYRSLVKRFKVVLWDILTYDFEIGLDQKAALEGVLKKTTTGSVVVFHDSERAKENVLYMLPRFLKHFNDLGYQFEAIQ